MVMKIMKTIQMVQMKKWMTMNEKELYIKDYTFEIEVVSVVKVQNACQ